MDESKGLSQLRPNKPPNFSLTGSSKATATSRNKGENMKKFKKKTYFFIEMVWTSHTRFLAISEQIELES